MKFRNKPALALALAVVLTVGFCTATNAEEIIVKPTGEFSKIDVAPIHKTIDVLKNGTPEQKDKLIADIKASSQNYAPPVFYLLSNILFEKGEKDEGSFWFYAGQLRGRFDANICADVSARQAIAILNMNFGTPINQYTLKDIPKLEKLVDKVVAWDEKTPYNYDHRWINLHGMGAMMSGLDPKDQKKEELSLPKEQWDKIAAQTRKTYTDEFHEAMKELEKRRAAGNAK